MNPSLPHWSALHKVSKQIDYIYAILGPIVGVQQSLKEMLLFHVSGVNARLNKDMMPQSHSVP